jgi:hypothetical protein
MAQEKVHLRHYANSSSLRRTMKVRRIPQVLQALQLELFAAPMVMTKKDAAHEPIRT